VGKNLSLKIDTKNFVLKIVQNRITVNPYITNGQNFGFLPIAIYGLKNKEDNKTVKIKIAYLIECKERDNYKTGSFDTKKEAIYRLNEIANNSFYTCGEQIIKRAEDFFTLSDNATFQIVKINVL